MNMQQPEQPQQDETNWGGIAAGAGALGLGAYGLGMLRKRMGGARPPMQQVPPTLPRNPQHPQLTAGAQPLNIGMQGLNRPAGPAAARINATGMPVAQVRGKMAALQTLGFKEAAIGASTIMPKALHPTGGALHAAKLQQLASPAARNNLPAGISTESPSLLYATLMGRPRAGESGNSLAFRQQIVNEALPDLRQLRAKGTLGTEAPTMAPPARLRNAG